jgi:hypothetical protein
MGIHRCRTPDAARLYSSPSMRANDLAILVMRLASDRSGGSSHRSIQAMYLSRQSSARGTGYVSMASASSAPYPSSRESTNASFEGSSSIGFAPLGSEGAPEGSSRLEGVGSRLTDGLATSHAKTFGGTVVHPDAILASSSASSLYQRGTWLSLCHRTCPRGPVRHCSTPPFCHRDSSRSS